MIILKIFDQSETYNDFYIDFNKSLSKSRNSFALPRGPISKTWDPVSLPAVNF